MNGAALGAERGALLELTDGTVDYGARRALDVPRLELARGEVLTLVGHNGSGKSTLLRLLGLLVPPSRGRLRFEGQEVDWSRPRAVLAMRRRMSGVLQEPLLCRMSVYQNVALGLRFRGVGRREIERRVMPWLERLRIDGLRDRPGRAISGGEAQRTSLARALVLEPEVLFLDEPFSALDAPSRNALVADFQAVLSDAGITTVFATHDRAEALGMGDRIAVLIDGRVVQLGPAEEVFSRPASPEVARFLGVETLIPGRVGGVAEGLVRVACQGFELEVAGSAEPGEHVLVSVRPEEITLYDGREPHTGSARNVLEGCVTRIAPMDALYRVEMDCGVPVVAVVTRPSFRTLQLAPGRPVRAVFKATAAHLIPRPPEP